MMSAENKGMLLGAIGVASFALTLPATRYLVHYLDPVFIGLGRSLFASLVALVILTVTRQTWPSWEQRRALVIVALGVVVGFPILSAIAMQSLPASHGGVVLAILPLATTAMGTLVTQERPSLGFWVLSVIGAALVVAYSLWRGEGFQFEIADLLLLLAVVSAAAGYAFGGKLANEIGGWQVICWALVLAAPLLLIPTLIWVPFAIDNSQTLFELGLVNAWSRLPHTALLCFAYLTLISQLIGFFFWYRGLALGGVARVSQLQLLQPFITIAVSAWLLNEVIDSSTTWFAIAVVMVVALGKRMNIAKQPPPRTTL